MTETTIIRLALLFLAAALLYSSVGHGGGSAYLAAMALLTVQPTIMKPTSLTLNVLVASIGTYHIARAGHFSWKLIWPFAVGVGSSYVSGWSRAFAVGVLPAAGGLRLRCSGVSSDHAMAAAIFAR